MILARLGLVLCIALTLASCASPITRTVDESFTRTTADSIAKVTTRNEPNNQSGGVIFPSSKTVETTRTLVQTDSIIQHDYPAFIRFGLFESVGMIGSAASGKGLGSGMFGLFYSPEDLLSSVSNPKSSSVFGGAIYRFGFAEYRLRWFRDTPGWTLGLTAYEQIYPDAVPENSLVSFGTLTLRRRWFLREEIPYLSVSGALSLGLFPSQYAHLYASFDAGSIGGFNLHAYLGLVEGVNAANTRINNTKTAVTVTAPYFGLGVSLMDFLNRVPELSVEWDNHEHSAWNVGVAHVTLLRTGQDSSFFGSAFPLQGLQLLLLPTSIALPVLHHRLYVGTELADLVIAGGQRQKIGFKSVTMVSMGLGILPIRIGYWQPVMKDELSFEPFIEYSYLPSSMFQMGARLNLYATRNLNLSFNLGYITSGGFDTSSDFFKENLGNGLGAFSTFYAGISVGFLDRIFGEEELRYNRPEAGRP